MPDEKDRREKIVATFKKKGLEMFLGLVLFRIIGWFSIAPSMKGCGELLAKVSEDQKKRIVSGLAAGSINLKNTCT